MGGIYGINIITMLRLNCVTPLIKDDRRNSEPARSTVCIVSENGAVSITVIQVYDGDVIISVVLARSNKNAI